MKGGGIIDVCCKREVKEVTFSFGGMGSLVGSSSPLGEK